MQKQELTGKRQEAWTISRYQQWVKCPLQYALEHHPHLVIDRFKGWTIKRLPEREKGPALQRGIDVHEMFDVFLQTGVPPEEMHPHFPIFDRWGDLLFALRDTIESADAGGNEVMWSYDEEWYPVERGAAVWHRQKLDAWVVNDDTAVVTDFKTGKYYDTNLEQMEVYTVGTFARFDDVQTVYTGLWYVDMAINDDEDNGMLNPLTAVYTREEDASRLANRWEKRARQFLEDTEYRAKPNFLCRYCAFNAKKGGPCTKGI